MILYNITYNVLPTVEKEWLAWMRHKHLPLAMATQLLSDVKILKLLTEIDSDGITYTLQYWFRSMADCQRFQELHIPGFEEQHHSRFANQYVCFQTLLEEM